jgi:hypothetical protein
MSLELAGEIARIGDVGPARLDVSLRHALECLRIAVEHRDTIIARCTQKFCNGNPDFSAARDRNFFHLFFPRLISISK